MKIDLGAILPINQIRFLGNEEAFLRAYELFMHNGDPKQLRDDRPIAYTNLVRINLEQDDPVIDVEIPLQFVRFIRLISRSTQEFTLEEVEVFGDGFAPTGSFTSEVVDLGEPANFSRIELLARMDSLTNVVLQTRSGSVPDPLVYYRKTELFEGEARAEEPILPIGSPETAQEYKNLVAADQGQIVENVAQWSPWSSPYKDFTGIFLSPGNRQYVQFRLFFSSQNARHGAAVESFSFAYSTPTLARELVAEITPASVVLGEIQTIDYYIRAEVSSTNTGFDQVEIKTPFKAKIKSVELEGIAVPFEKIEEDNRLSVLLTEDRITASSQLLRITFDVLVTVYGTTFFGKVFDSQSGESGQDIFPGDATPASLTDRLAVQGNLRPELVLNLQSSTHVFTPNGDGINDTVEISYLLLKALTPVRVELRLYDLSGRLIRTLQQEEVLNGPQVITWNGQDDNRQVVPPGLYMLKLAVDTDTVSEDQTQILAVAY